MRLAQRSYGARVRAHGGRQTLGMFHRHRKGRAGKGVHALHGQLSCQRRATNANPPRTAIRAKGGRIEEHEAREPLGHLNRGTQPDRAAPIVRQQRDAAQIELLDQPPQVGDMLRQPIRIVPRLVGESAADMVRRDEPVPRPQRLDQLPPIERPRRVAMHQQQRLSLAFVDVMIAPPVDAQLMGRKRVQRSPIVDA